MSMKRTQWEYRIAHLPVQPYVADKDTPQERTLDAEAVLNECGRDGWEVFHVQDQYTAYMMRPVQVEEEIPGGRTA